MRQYRYGVHWLSFVLDGPKERAFMIYDLFFKDLFGELQSMGHGGRVFQEIWYSLLGFKVYVLPSRGELEYFHFEIPGQACEQIDWGILQALDDILRSNYPEQYYYSRLDFAFDDLPFKPQDVEEAINGGHVRSLAKRETMTINKSPFEKKENGELGTYTVNFGSRQSERMIRVYDRRGFTRLELEMKGKRADLVAKQIFRASDVSEWFSIALSHLRDYINFDATWWEEFVYGVGRAWAIVSTPREISEAITTRWLERQVAPALSVIHDIRPDNFLKDLIRLGRIKRKRGNKYDLLLSGKTQKLDIYDE
jgi:DNA relaxase NicK